MHVGLPGSDCIQDDTSKGFKAPEHVVNDVALSRDWRRHVTCTNCARTAKHHLIHAHALLMPFAGADFTCVMLQVTWSMKPALRLMTTAHRVWLVAMDVT